MINACYAYTLICISSYDKITPGILLASLRLNITTIFVSASSIKAGKIQLACHGINKVEAMVIAADASVSDEEVAEYERNATKPEIHVPVYSPPTR